MATTCYALRVDGQAERWNSLVKQFGPEILVPGLTKKKRGKKTMATDVQEKQEKKETLTKVVSVKVFDLKAFSEIELGKVVTLPAKPTSLDEATQLIPDSQHLLSIIWQGMCAEAIEAAEEEKTGWKTFDDEGNLFEEFTGASADSEKKKLIQGMILNFAKGAFGYGKHMTAEEKNAAKESARKMLFENKAMIDKLASS
jgi:hypothetical protein